MVLRVPHGVTGHIIPWNYPAQIFGRSVGRALATGNACVVKPAEDACLTPLRISRLALKPGCRRGAERRLRAWAKKPAPRWPRTRASTTSRSPAAPGGHAVAQAAANHVR
jgi:aldehyde dehydrogenase (NAD+)